MVEIGPWLIGRIGISAKYREVIAFNIDLITIMIIVCRK
jgi:hypothetical protein